MSLIPCNEISMELKLSNSNILEQLRHGFARFELVSSPTSSVSYSISSSSLPASFLGTTQGNNYLFFASTKGHRPCFPSKKVGKYKVAEVTKDDSRSLFRALVKGMALNEKGDATLDAKKERDDADNLQNDVKDVMCNGPKERERYKEAIAAVTEIHSNLDLYCQRIGKYNFQGGKPELLVLSKLKKQPIIVYELEKEDYIPTAEYGAETGVWETLKNLMRKKKKVVRLLYNVETNHYDLLY